MNAMSKFQSHFSRALNVCTFSLQDPPTPRGSPSHSPPENGLDKARVLKKDAPNSPASVASSGSTPSSKAKDHPHVRAEHWPLLPSPTSLFLQSHHGDNSLTVSLHVTRLSKEIKSECKDEAAFPPPLPVWWCRRFWFNPDYNKMSGFDWISKRELSDCLWICAFAVYSLAAL